MTEQRWTVRSVLNELDGTIDEAITLLQKYKSEGFECVEMLVNGSNPYCQEVDLVVMRKEPSTNTQVNQ